MFNKNISFFFEWFLWATSSPVSWAAQIAHGPASLRYWILKKSYIRKNLLQNKLYIDFKAKMNNFHLYKLFVFQSWTNPTISFPNVTQIWKWADENRAQRFSKRSRIKSDINESCSSYFIIRKKSFSER